MLLFKATYSWKTQADMQLRLVCINRNFLKAPNSHIQLQLPTTGAEL